MIPYQSVDTASNQIILNAIQITIISKLIIIDTFSSKNCLLSDLAIAS